jgi:protein-tyrosine phosphatase
MFSIFKKSSQPALDLSGIGTDMHAHFLPGIDDGAPDAEAGLKLVQSMMNMGLQHFIPTPHIYWDWYKNTPQTIQQAANALQQYVSEQQLTLPIQKPAAEYFLDAHLLEQVRGQEPLLTISGKKILVEFSFVSAPMSWKDDLFQLQIAGYEPILAHPERYVYLDADKRVYHTLADMGIALQVNILSFTGYYNKEAQALAQYLLKQRLISYFGTDIHHERHLQAFYQGAKPIMQALDMAQQSRPLLNRAL